MHKLYAPSGYWRLSPTAIAEICNGCGPAGPLGAFVPDSILGVDISEACNIHDYMYHFGETLDGKEMADRVFLNNMLRIVIRSTKAKWLVRLRTRLAYRYYQAVRDYGGPYYWSGKNNPKCEEPERAFDAWA